MKTLYVSRNGAKITREALRFLIRYQGEILQEIPAHSLELIVMIGKVEISHDAIVLAHNRGILVIAMTNTGKIKFSLFELNPKNIVLRLKQYSLFAGENKLKIAKSLIYGKVKNSRTILQKYARNRGENFVMAEIDDLQKSLENIETIQDLNGLMGVEGFAARRYYSGLSKMIGQDFGFQERNRRPPKDPVNAMLSFGYTLLYSRVLNCIRMFGLDPFLGCLHEPKDRRMSLALDLMEEFRGALVDRVVIGMINRVMVTPSDFVMTEKNGVQMSQKAISILVTEFETRMEEKVIYSPTGKQLTWKHVVLSQTGRFRRLVLGEEENYQSFQIR